MEEEKWKFTEADPKWTGESEQPFRVALIDELDQLNKTLSVIASNQERSIGGSAFIPTEKAMHSHEPIL